MQYLNQQQIEAVEDKIIEDGKVISIVKNTN